MKTASEITKILKERGSEHFIEFEQPNDILGADAVNWSERRSGVSYLAVFKNCRNGYFQIVKRYSQMNVAERRELCALLNIEY